MIKKPSRKTSILHNWQVTFNGMRDSLEGSFSLSEQASGRILNVKDLNVHHGDSVQITSAGRSGGKDFVAQWNVLLSAAAISDQNPGSKPKTLDWQDIGWLPLNKNKKNPSFKFGFQGRGATYLQLKYSDQPVGTGMPMLMSQQPQPNKMPSKEMVIRIIIVVS